MEIFRKISLLTDEEFNQLEREIRQLADTRYSEANLSRVEELKKEGLPTWVAHQLGRSVEIDGPILTDPQALARMPDEEILSIRGIGPKGLESIKNIKP